MQQIIVFFKNAISAIYRENIHKIALVVLLVIFFGSVTFAYFEEKMNITDALWWSVVTMTTVGYGDISPASPGGRIVGLIVMLLGIGFLGLFTATIASIFVENRLLENKGMKSTRIKGHFIICGWNFRGNEIVTELRADVKSSDTPVVIIADVTDKPIDDRKLHFVRGEINADTLERANAKNAQVIMVLSDDQLDFYARDAKTILNILTIKNLYPEIYTCVELMDAKNVDHCKMAKADEIIVVGELSTNLLVQAALDHGITRLISELVSNRYGEDLYKMKAPSDLVNQPFFQVMCSLKQTHNILCLGIESSDGENFMANPDNDYKLEKDDKLIVVASKRPDLK